jgi:hypothetical protein
LSGNLPFKQGIGEPEALMLVGAGIEDHQRTGADTFDFADRVLAKSAPFVQAARVREHVSPACSIDVKMNRLLTDWTLCEKRVSSPPGEQFYEFRNPYG